MAEKQDNISAHQRAELPGQRIKIYSELKYLQSLRKVTRGITHNYNNIFSGVLGSLEAHPRHEYSEHNLNLNELIGRAITETEILFGFARHSPSENKIQTFSGIVESAVSALRAVSPRHTVRHLCSDPFIRVEGCISDITLLLFYLGENSIEATPEGGEVFFSITDTFDDNGALWIEAAVSDGAEIDAAVLDSMFSPFVTTRSDSGHYGLGLYIAREIATIHGGDVKYSQDGEGRGAFILRLPATMPTTSASLTAGKKSHEHPVVQEKKHYVFFVVDDDEMLLEYISAGLQRRGHMVFSASSCREALEDFENVADIVTLFVVDVGLTDSSGMECVKRLKEIDSSPGVVMISGEHMGDTLPMNDNMVFLQKPFTIRQLEEIAAHVTTLR